MLTNKVVLRLDRWWQHRKWHATQPAHYMRYYAEGVDDWITCPFCYKLYTLGEYMNG